MFKLVETEISKSSGRTSLPSQVSFSIVVSRRFFVVRHGNERKGDRSEAMIVASCSLLEDVVEHLVHFGAVEIRHGNLRRRNHQAQTLICHPRHGATPGQSDRTLRRVPRGETSVLRVPRLRAAVVRIVEVSAYLILHSLHADRGRGRLVLLLHLEGRR